MKKIVVAVVSIVALVNVLGYCSDESEPKSIRSFSSPKTFLDRLKQGPRDTVLNVAISALCLLPLKDILSESFTSAKVLVNDVVEGKNSMNGLIAVSKKFIDGGLLWLCWQAAMKFGNIIVG